MKSTPGCLGMGEIQVWGSQKLMGQESGWTYVREGLECHVPWLGVCLISNKGVGSHGAFQRVIWSDLWFVNMALSACGEVGEKLVAGK